MPKWKLQKRKLSERSTKWTRGGRVSRCRVSRRVAGNSRMVARKLNHRLAPLLIFRLLFAYHDSGFSGPMVGRYEFTHRVEQRRKTVASQSLAATEARSDTLLRLPGNAATFALLPSESSA